MGTRNNRNNRLSHYGQLFCKNSILTLRGQTFFEFQLVTKVLILCCTVKTVASPALFHEPYNYCWVANTKVKIFWLSYVQLCILFCDILWHKIFILFIDSSPRTHTPHLNKCFFSLNILSVSYNELCQFSLSFGRRFQYPKKGVS